MTQALSIAVIGAGLMGHGIALSLARAGYRVTLTDPVAAARAAAPERIADSLRLLGADAAELAAALGRVQVVPTVAQAVAAARFVFEAAPEKLPLKQALFAEIEAAAPPEAILATNTSALPVTAVMSRLRGGSRALGTHWWNPPHLVPLVEVIRTAATSEATLSATIELLAAVGKTPVRVEKDVPGFIGNRLQFALWREAISLVERGICDAAAVDAVVKAGFGRRLAVLGPLENADLIGTDLTLDIHRTVLPEIDSRPAPAPLLEQMVAEGRLGMKAGRGFHDWSPEAAQAVRERLVRHLLAQGTVSEGSAPEDGASGGGASGG